ncbi:VCBS domain-containing protein, partial [Microvirga sp. BT689]|uniref:VCBS domain-containing protein n=1 Tax=Microvirga arvi TaxID=2778731 RepID=UPI00194E0F4D
NAAAQVLKAGEEVAQTLTVESLDGTARQTVTVTITGTNDAPVVSGAVEGGEHVEDGDAFSVDLLAHASDVDHDAVLTIKGGEAGITATVVTGEWAAPLQFALVDGTLSIDPAQFQALAEGEILEVALSYVVSDGLGGEAPATARFTVTGTNDAPVITGGNISGEIVEPEAPAGIRSYEGVLAFSDVDLVDVHSVDVIDNSGDQTGVTFSAGIIAEPVDGLPGEVGWTVDVDTAVIDSLAAGEVRTLTYTLLLSDLSGGRSEQVVTITLTGTNDGPVAVADVAAGTENETLTLDVLANDTDVDTGAVFTLVSGVAPAGKGTAAVVDNKLVFTPGTAFDHLAQGATETVTLSYTMRDEHGLESASTVTVTVTGTNDGATISGTDAGSVTEDSTRTTGGTLIVTDVDTGEAVFRAPASLNGTYGTFVFDAATGEWSYVLDNSRSATQALAAGQTVSDTLTVTSHDGTASHAIAVTLTGANDAAVISGTSTGAVSEDGSQSTGGVLAVADVDAGESTFKAVAAADLQQAYGSFSFDAGTGAWGFVLDNAAAQVLKAGEEVAQTLTVESLDGTARQTVTVTITGTNDAPVVSGAVDGGARGEDEAFSLALLAQASDVDHDAVLAIKDGAAGLQVSTSGAAWTAALQFTLVDGSLSLDPAQFKGLGAGEVVEVTLTYTVTDGQGGETPATARFTVTGADDALAGLSLSGTQVTENAPGGTLVGSLLGLDPDRTSSFSYALVEDASGLFEISGNELRVKAGAVIDYESAISHTLRIAVSNGLEQVIETVTLTVQDVQGAVIVGSNQAEVINGTVTVPGQAFASAEDDQIDGRGGNDALAGLAGNDQLLGGAGDDTLDGGAGADTLDGGTGADSLSGGAGDDTLVLSGTEALGDVLAGGEGHDTVRVGGTGALSLNHFSAALAGLEVWAGNGQGLTGTIGADALDLSGLVTVTGLPSVDGGAGNDVLTGTGFADDLRGSAGDDRLAGGAGDDLLRGGSGADTLLGGAGNDRLQITSTEATGDSLSGGEGEDTLEVIGAAATVLGSFDAGVSSIEHLLGNGRALVGTGGDDGLDFSGLKSLEKVLYVDASTGNDRLVGHAGADDLRGGSGLDTLVGGSGADTLDGGYGDDTVDGGADADVLKGGVGNDWLVGGLGADTLSGGTGQDTFVFTGQADGGDLISDFMQGADTIALVGTGFGLAAGPLAAGRFALDAATVAQGQFVYEQASSMLLWDADGTGSGAGVTIARFRSGLILNADDLTIL